MICNAFACRTITPAQEAKIGKLMLKSASDTKREIDRRRMVDKTNNPRVVSQKITAGDQTILAILNGRPMLAVEIAEHAGRSKKGIVETMRRLRKAGHVVSAVADLGSGALIWRLV